MSAATDDPWRHDVDRRLDAIAEERRDAAALVAQALNAIQEREASVQAALRNMQKQQDLFSAALEIQDQTKDAVVALQLQMDEVKERQSAIFLELTGSRVDDDTLGDALRPVLARYIAEEVAPVHDTHERLALQVKEFSEMHENLLPLHTAHGAQVLALEHRCGALEEKIAKLAEKAAGGALAGDGVEDAPAVASAAGPPTAAIETRLDATESRVALLDGAIERVLQAAEATNVRVRDLAAADEAHAVAVADVKETAEAAAAAVPAELLERVTALEAARGNSTDAEATTAPPEDVATTATTAAAVADVVGRVERLEEAQREAEARQAQTAGVSDCGDRIAEVERLVENVQLQVAATRETHAVAHGDVCGRLAQVEAAQGELTARVGALADPAIAAAVNSRFDRHGAVIEELRDDLAELQTQAEAQPGLIDDVRALQDAVRALQPEEDEGAAPQPAASEGDADVTLPPPPPIPAPLAVDAAHVSRFHDLAAWLDTILGQDASLPHVDHVNVLHSSVDALEAAVAAAREKAVGSEEGADLAAADPAADPALAAADAIADALTALRERAAGVAQRVAYARQQEAAGADDATPLAQLAATLALLDAKIARLVEAVGQHQKDRAGALAAVEAFAAAAAADELSPAEEEEKEDPTTQAQRALATALGHLEARVDALETRQAWVKEEAAPAPDGLAKDEDVAAISAEVAGVRAALSEVAQRVAAVGARAEETPAAPAPAGMTAEAAAALAARVEGVEHSLAAVTPTATSALLAVENITPRVARLEAEHVELAEGQRRLESAAAANAGPAAGVDAATPTAGDAADATDDDAGALERKVRRLSVIAADVLSQAPAEQREAVEPRAAALQTQLAALVGALPEADPGRADAAAALLRMNGEADGEAVLLESRLRAAADVVSSVVATRGMVRGEQQQQRRQQPRQYSSPPRPADITDATPPPFISQDADAGLGAPAGGDAAPVRERRERIQAALDPALSALEAALVGLQASVSPRRRPLGGADATPAAPAAVDPTIDPRLNSLEERYRDLEAKIAELTAREADPKDKPDDVNISPTDDKPTPAHDHTAGVATPAPFPAPQDDDADAIDAVVSPLTPGADDGGGYAAVLGEVHAAPLGGDDHDDGRRTPDGAEVSCNGDGDGDAASMASPGTAPAVGAAAITEVVAVAPAAAIPASAPDGEDTFRTEAQRRLTELEQKITALNDMATGAMASPSPSPSRDHHWTPGPGPHHAQAPAPAAAPASAAPPGAPPTWPLPERIGAYEGWRREQVSRAAEHESRHRSPQRPYEQQRAANAAAAAHPLAELAAGYASPAAVYDVQAGAEGMTALQREAARSMSPPPPPPAALTAARGGGTPTAAPHTAATPRRAVGGAQLAVRSPSSFEGLLLDDSHRQHAEVKRELRTLRAARRADEDELASVCKQISVIQETWHKDAKKHADASAKIQSQLQQLMHDHSPNSVALRAKLDKVQAGIQHAKESILAKQRALCRRTDTLRTQVAGMRARERVLMDDLRRLGTLTNLAHERSMSPAAQGVSPVMPDYDEGI